MTSSGRRGNIMEDMTVEDMIKALKQTSTAMLACGGTEQHGYHLPLSADHVIGYEIGKEVSRRSACLLLPPLCYSFSGGKLPGTTDISPETTSRVITEIGLSIAEQGIRNIILFCPHCGGKHLNAVKEAGYQIMEQAKRVSVALVPILSISRTWTDLLAGGGEHAGKGETSLMLYTRPDLVRDKRPYDTARTQKPQRTPKPRQSAFLVRHCVLKKRAVPPRESPDKYGVPDGSAQQATKKFGKVLFDEMVQTLVDLVQFMNKRARTARPWVGKSLNEELAKGQQGRPTKMDAQY